MTKMTKTAMRTVNGGSYYICKCGKGIWGGAFAVGWHNIFTHGGNKYFTVRQIW